MKWTARFSACLGACSVAFMSVASFHVHAEDTIKKLTVGQTRALFGDTISATYYDTSAGDYLGCTFSYLTSTTVNGIYARESGYDAFMDAVGDTLSTSFLIYQSDITRPVSDQSYFTVRLTPSISLGMLNEFHMVAGFSSPAMQDNDGNWVSAIIEPRDISRGGFPYNNWSILQNGNLVSGDSLTRWTNNSNINDWLSWGIAGTSQTARRFFVPNCINLYSDSYFSVSDLHITRQGNCGANLSQSARILLYISTPILTSDYTDNNNGGSGGGSTGTDLTSTNMKLDTIIQILSRLANEAGQGSDSDRETPERNQVVNDANIDFGDASDSADDLWDAIASYDDIQNDINDVVIDDDSGITFDPMEIPDNVPDIAPALQVVDAGNYIIDAFELDETVSPVMPMIMISLGICLFSYILFGKWV